jgi:hypothetical protein
VVKTDNTGPLFMIQDSSKGVQSRHVNSRYHYVQENIEKGIVKNDFVKSSDNYSDIYTEKVSREM